MRINHLTFGSVLFPVDHKRTNLLMADYATCKELQPEGSFEGQDLLYLF